MKNKMLATMITLILVILLAGAIAIIVIYKMDHTSANNGPSIDKVVESSVDVPEITTNLKNNNFIKIALKIETDSKKAKKELEKRDFQVKDAVIDELSETSSEDLDSKEGKQKFLNNLKKTVDQYMQNGKIVKIYITSYVVQ
ncbi:flagellar basal body-associated protein FliL [Heyndrickxia oleronia]|uniref:Flagellar protein FliL n=1 Tax=Heyndrickxia oleronia TaxID=38875 RepID=A0A8E2I5N5_9BACI|nr:flagellar basal body-associated protein FliL [Heyndrickxia oleronia]MCM3237716.1 flagellar basal body-associated protein FliL [Heyndrickxia oleronia]MDH5161200.1 flagellar basal body-associated protein FliL [Heyndrickxia oleronia]MEC1376171.1 flagellar basal body-associated protein FliL [Heyndrickxia oleronia]OOP67181.1 flagellar basal body-associated protein FliL [Heyndrickxia oleronia]QQZ03214.1 flagellar basal body-associated protein FliL [Heyndrickxia oleronia]